ncbi:MAG TPA: protein kinase [Ktedonobacteraceae bacterium]|nr:protein kinase [Ktedonobacteraceae bacterium]
MQTLAMNQLTGEDTGKYRINRLLGQGPVSSFYEASSVSGKNVMLTAFYLPENFSAQAREHFLRRFEQTGAVLVGLKHPAILPVEDYGQYRGYPYLVTPIRPGRSLAHGLRVHGRFPIEAVLEILPLIAEGLDYAHRAGVVHGVLSPSNILLGIEPKVQIASFGLMRILALQGLEPKTTAPLGPLLNVAGGYLGTPAYIAPEQVKPANRPTVSFGPRIDIYALGVMLFEMLSGRPPFIGETPQEVDLQRSQLLIPSLSELLPTLPAGVDAVIAKALSPTPELRYSSAGGLSQAFRRIALPSSGFSLQGIAGDSGTTGPLVINWLNENALASGKQAVPGSAGRPRNPQEFDPFAWWANVSATQSVNSQKLARTMPVQSRPLSGEKTGGNKPSRRKVVALLAGGVGAVAVAGVGGEFVLTRLLRQGEAKNTGATTSAALNSQPAKTISKQPTKAPTRQATKAPTQHTGTVIAPAPLAVNSAQNFTSGGQSNVLIRLPGGNYVAYSRACTHVGVLVNYDPGSHQLICPAHGAIFDPANNGSVVQPPANSPLPPVTVHVNPDGTITV